MNQITLSCLDGVPVRRPRIRDMAKIVTRRKLVASARARFLDLGYESTTLREVAADAQRSVGAVFSCFSDKLELLEAVLADEAVGLGEAAKAAVSGSPDFTDTLFRLHNLMTEPAVARLILIDRHLPPERRVVAPLIDAVLMDTVGGARDRGDIVPHVQLEVICSLIWDLLSGWCLCIVDDHADLDVSLARSRAKIDLLVTALTQGVHRPFAPQSRAAAFCSTPDA